MINKLENYLIGENGYLKNDLSNGKVIMLSGKWGSGKTHFWQNRIIPKLNYKNIKVANHYISLYGKTSIDEIKNEIFIKIFESVDSSEIEEKSLDITKKSVGIVSSLSKTVSVFGMSLDLSKITDKTFESLENLLENKKLKKTEEYLNSGAVICFDDFERKSKEIDLNDLFGFITQLTLNFDCTVVIILNDDVFEGEEKRIFSNVKEKSVSKFLYYKPTIEELFNLIFESDEKYCVLTENKAVILKTIEETEELNARVYIQVLDNLLEWIYQEKDSSFKILRCLILVNINFILNHLVYNYNNDGLILPTLFTTFKSFPISILIDFRENLHTFDNMKSRLEVIDSLNESAKSYYQNSNNSSQIKATESLTKDLELIEEYGDYFWNYVNFENNLKYRKDISSDKLKEINNFIETGIL